MAYPDFQYKVHCIRIEPLWGVDVYLTEHPYDLTMSNGRVYVSDNSYSLTGISLESAMSPGVVDLSGIADLVGIDYNEIVSGVFDNARVYIFATQWDNPAEDQYPIGLCFFGKTTIRDKKYTTELMMAVDALNQSVGKTYAPLCYKTFGGQEYAGCKVALGPITVTGTITSVTGNSVFRDSTRSELDDYFAEGTIAFTSGANAGLKPLEIKSYVGVLSKSITGITKAASAVVTVGAHTFVAGDVVGFSGVSGMTEINGLTGTITSVAATTITVNINSTGFSTYTSGGTAAQLAGGITTYEPFNYPIVVGDAYTMIPGCRKRKTDCKDKWNNFVNFGGFPHVPKSSQYQDRGLK